MPLRFHFIIISLASWCEWVDHMSHYGHPSSLCSFVKHSAGVLDSSMVHLNALYVLAHASQPFCDLKFFLGIHFCQFNGFPSSAQEYSKVPIEYSTSNPSTMSPVTGDWLQMWCKKDKNEFILYKEPSDSKVERFGQAGYVIWKWNPVHPLVRLSQKRLFSESHVLNSHLPICAWSVSDYECKAKQ